MNIKINTKTIYVSEMKDARAIASECKAITKKEIADIVEGNFKDQFLYKFQDEKEFVSIEALQIRSVMVDKYNGNMSVYAEVLAEVTTMTHCTLFVIVTIDVMQLWKYGCVSNTENYKLEVYRRDWE